MIDLKDFTIEELLSIYLADPTEDEEPRESTDREIAASILADYPNPILSTLSRIVPLMLVYLILCINNFFLSMHR